MHSNEKSPEVLKAQTAGFIAESQLSFGAKDVLFKNLGDIAVLDNAVRAIVVSPVNGLVEVDGNTSQQPDINAPDFRNEVLKQKDYVKFLRNKRGASNEAIQSEANLLQAYGAFEPDVANLQEEIRSMPDVHKHPAYLGGGVGARAFSLHKNGHEYVVQTLRWDNPYGIYIKLQGGLRGKNIPHVEQIVAASYEQGITVAERIPGRSLDKLSADDLGKINADQLGILIDTLKIAIGNGIRLDFKPGNLMYDPVEGFGLIDYTATNNPQDLTEVLIKTAETLSQAGDWASSEESESGFWSPAQIKRHNANLYAANIKVLETLCGAITNRMPGEEGRIIAPKVENYLALYRTYRSS